MKKILFILIGFIILGALAYPKIRPLTGASSEQGDASDEDGSALRVDAVVVEPQELEDKIFTTGTLRADEEIELRSEASGKVVEVLMQEGQPVQEGDLLVKINDRELQAQLQRAHYRLELATERERRQERLLERGGISQEDYDATLNEVNVLESEVELIEAQIEKTEIRAPFDGVVGLKYISNGSYISPETRIASLQSINPIKIDFSIPERYAGTVEEGAPIYYNVQGLDNGFEAEIYAIEPRIDEDTRTLNIRARGDNSGGLLFPGAFARLELVLEELDDALMVPTVSIVPEMNREKVFKYSNGRVVEQEVSTGIRTSDNIQIVEGLAPGDTVLTTGLLQVREDMPVRLGTVGEVEEDTEASQGDVEGEEVEINDQ